MAELQSIINKRKICSSYIVFGPCDIVRAQEYYCNSLYLVDMCQWGFGQNQCMVFFTTFSCPLCNVKQSAQRSAADCSPHTAATIYNTSQDVQSGLRPKFQRLKAKQLCGFDCTQGFVITPPLYLAPYFLAFAIYQGKSSSWSGASR